MLKLKQFVLKRVKTQDGDIYFADVVKIKIKQANSKL